MAQSDFPLLQRKRVPETVALGVDIGGSELRIAEHAESARTAAATIDRSALPRVIRNAETQAGSASPLLRIQSLKRLLDVDVDLPMAPGGKNAVAVLAEILSGARERRELAHGAVPLRWAVSVPPCFSQRQRAAIRAACVDAGFRYVRLFDDTRAILEASDVRVRAWNAALVCSWGASTLSIALYRRALGGWETVAQGGDNGLGSDDLAATVCSAAVATLRTAGVPVPGGHTALELAPQLFASIGPMLEEFAGGNTGPIDIRRLIPDLHRLDDAVSPPMIDRAHYDNSLRTLLYDAERLLRNLLEEANACRPDGVILAGGMMNIPAVVTLYGRVTDLPVLRAEHDAVVVGASLLGSQVRSAGWEPSAERAAAQVQRPPASKARQETPAAWTGLFLPALERAEAAERSGNLAEAISEIDGLFQELAAFTGELYRRQADRLLQSGEEKDAYDLLRRAVQRHGASRLVALEFARHSFRLGHAAYKRRNAAKALAYAVAGAEALEARDAADPDVRSTLALLLHLRGCALLLRGLASDARDLFDRCVELMPGEIQFTEDLATVTKALKGKAPAVLAKSTKSGPVARNALCPCGSGRKYKLCCGA